jgi:hypothetical protein
MIFFLNSPQLVGARQRGVGPGYVCVVDLVEVGLEIDGLGVEQWLRKFASKQCNML